MFKRKRKKRLEDRRIIDYYGASHPNIAYCAGGARQLAVDPHDRRARRMLLAKGPNYFSTNQRLIFNFLSNMPVSLFLDIGSNYGECLVSAPHYSEIKTKGFEPNPCLLPFLEETLKINPDLSNISLINKAVSDQEGGDVEFYVSADWSGKSSLTKEVAGNKVQKITVPRTTIDAEVAGEKDINLLLVKVDVEGNEPRVLDGGISTLSTIPNVVILIEFNERYLISAGFNPRRFLESLTKIFSVTVYSNKLVPSIATYDELVKCLFGKKVHCDLLLSRFQDQRLENMAKSVIANSAAGAELQLCQ